MATAKIFCAVIGETTSFPVNIGDAQTVGDLKEEIKGKKVSITCDADLLKLYLTKKNNTSLEWLLTENQDTGLSADQVIRTIAERQKAVLGEGPVHVLVEVPENTAGPAIAPPEFAQLTQEMHEEHAQTVLTKRKRYVHSRVGSTEGNELLNDLSIKVDPVRAGQFHTGNNSVKNYEWKRVVIENDQEIVLTKEQQRTRYREYVECNIGAVLVEKQLCVVGVERGTNILSVKVPGREVDLIGRTDMLILSDIVKEDESDLQYLPGVKMLIEVKRDIQPRNDFQALSELIALDLLVTEPVMALLTDLREEWLFFWVAEKTTSSARICKAAINKPGKAFEIISAVLVQPPTASTEIKLPCFQSPLKRLKRREVLPPSGEGGGIRESIERYYDIASMLGPDVDMARAVAREITRSIPTFSYFI